MAQRDREIAIRSDQISCEIWNMSITSLAHARGPSCFFCAHPLVQQIQGHECVLAISGSWQHQAKLLGEKNHSSCSSKPKTVKKPPSMSWSHNHAHIHPREPVALYRVSPTWKGLRTSKKKRSQGNKSILMDWWPFPNMGKLPKFWTMTCLDALGKLKAVWSTENWTKNM